MDRENRSYAIGQMRFEMEGWCAWAWRLFKLFWQGGLRSVGRGDWRDYFRRQEGRWGVSQLFAAAESSVAAMGRMSQAIMPMLWRGSTGGQAVIYRAE